MASSWKESYDRRRPAQPAFDVVREDEGGADQGGFEIAGCVGGAFRDANSHEVVGDSAERLPAVGVDVLRHMGQQRPLPRAELGQGYTGVAVLDHASHGARPGSAAAVRIPDLHADSRDQDGREEGLVRMGESGKRQLDAFFGGAECGAPRRQFRTLAARMEASASLKPKSRTGCRLAQLGLQLHLWLRSFCCSVGVFHRSLYLVLPPASTSSLPVFPLPWVTINKASSES